MRINIVLQYKSKFLDNEDVIERITQDNNASYLAKGIDNPEFPYLSEVECDDYSDFGPKDMDALIKELLRVRREEADPSHQAHIDDIIRLANKCKKIPETILMFAG